MLVIPAKAGIQLFVLGRHPSARMHEGPTVEEF
jgi:hypothetical protein